MLLRLTIVLMAIMCAQLNAPQARAQDFGKYERQSLYVPVRDGTRLSVNIYRPANEDGVVQEKLPVVFVFTPYRARHVNAQGETVETALQDGLGLRTLIRSGYVVAVADIRGKGASFGTRRGFQDRTEAMDGHDLVEWLADQPFSTGDVGMVGCSYLGGTTMHTASTAPPSLRAVFTGATDWDKYAFVRRGGITAQFNTRPDEPLSDDLASIPVDADSDGSLLRSAVAQHAGNTPMGGLWYSMPYRNDISPFTNNAFWDEVAIWQYADTIREAGIATYMWGNWNDEPTSDVIVAAENLGSRLLVGPGSHCQAPRDFDLPGEIRSYFDYHLKGIDNGFTDQPRVTFWADDGDGEGHYVRGETYPGAASQALTYYLGGADHAGSENLSMAVRAGPAGQDTLTVDYDVANDAYFAFWPSPLDEHGLVYDTAPLDQPMELLGYPLAHLALSADRDDVDVFVYLEEVNAEGEAEVISFGRLKASQRRVSPAPWDNLGMPWHSGMSGDAQPLPQGETVMLQVPMLATTRMVPAGSRLRFAVTGADPRQRNLAEIRQDPAPQIIMARGWEAGSRIELPLVRQPVVAAAAQDTGEGE